MPKIRSFLAIELPPTIAQGIERVQGDLIQSHADVRWVEPSRIHLTLKFFGDIDKEACDEIIDAVGKAVSGVKPFSLTVKGLGAFPSIKNPRVIWLGIEDDGEVLKSLQRAVEEDLRRIGYPGEERKFKPHLTLGRVRSGRGKSGLLVRMEDLFHVDLGEFRVDRLVLFKSDLRPTGPIYSELRDFKLGGG
ncbi:MAG: RNA 2',3'-cyclic phosphodiesterase [Syntrophobacterales bacterium]|nr:MAG: RNA 2',3'-cyclic phosphodiesterase [Syntrophobacterales bacterium]